MNQIKIQKMIKKKIKNKVKKLPKNKQHKLKKKRKNLINLNPKKILRSQNHPSLMNLIHQNLLMGHQNHKNLKGGGKREKVQKN
jgi:hypothetical protein